VQMADSADGLDVGVAAYDRAAGAVVTTTVASDLTRAAAHAVVLRMFFFDGPENLIDLGFGDEIEFTQAPQSLTVLGISSRRKWS